MSITAPKGSAIRGTDLFRGMMEHFGKNVRGIRGIWRYGDNLAEVNKLVGQNAPLEFQSQRHGRLVARPSRVHKSRRDRNHGSPGAYSFIQALFTR